MDFRNFALRPEAGPVPCHLLTESQRKVLKRIIAALSEAQKLAEEFKGQRRSDEVDADRVSRIFFVSGEPGSGKSTVYLTLRHLLDRNSLPYGIQPTHKVTGEDRHQHEANGGRLNGLKQSICWLEPIDLEVAGEEGENLLAAVLVRLSRAFDDDPSEPNTARGQAMDPLEELANDIGIAWDGNLQARASSLDPSSYSQEVMQAQRARLRTNKRFRKALDTLSNDGCLRGRRQTLFVLPIDDFYLKPGVSLNLLRLLRMISVPRLFFLIMGEQKNMEALFFEKALADWTDVAGSQIFASLDKRRKNEVLSRAREMSARYFRKLLPIGQRATIEAMNLREALNYKPGINDSPDVPTLSWLLARVRLATSKTGCESSLLDFLAPKKVFESILSTKNAEGSIERQFDNEHYSAIQILETMPREILDLWMYFHQIEPHNGSSGDKDPADPGNAAPEYLEKIREILLIYIEEQNFLDDRRQDVLRSAFPTGFDMGSLESNKFTLSARHTSFISDLDQFPDQVLRKHLGWKLQVTEAGEDRRENKKKNPGDSFSHLPPRPTAWIILLHDLTWRWKSEKIAVNLVKQLIEQVNKPLNHAPELEDLGWAWYRSYCEDKYLRKVEVWRHYPFPDIKTFRQLDRFFGVWNYLLTKHADCSLARRKNIEFWICAGWIATGPDDHYDIKLLSKAVEAQENRQNSHDLDKDMQSLQALKDHLFANHPRFEELASAGDK